MDNKRQSEYLRSLEKYEDPLLEELRKYACEHDVPIVRRETESFLRTMVVMNKPGRILEIGTAIAYSTIVMAQAAGPDAHTDTIESYEKRWAPAETNVRRAGLEDRISLMHGDAGVILKELVSSCKSYDLIFLDAAKGQYLIWLPDIMKLMHEGSVLISDNVLQENTVMESRFTVERRDRTTHSRMREFLYTIKNHAELETSVLPLGDGVSISVKKS